jgi:hypothetical protein
MDETQEVSRPGVFQRRAQTPIRLQRDLIAGHGFHFAPDAVEVLYIIRSVPDGDVIHRCPVAS